MVLMVLAEPKAIENGLVRSEVEVETAVRQDVGWVTNDASNQEDKQSDCSECDSREECVRVGFGNSGISSDERCRGKDVIDEFGVRKSV
jgi:hypothetical protein